VAAGVGGDLVDTPRPRPRLHLHLAIGLVAGETSGLDIAVVGSAAAGYCLAVGYCMAERHWAARHTTQVRGNVVG